MGEAVADRPGRGGAVSKDTTRGGYGLGLPQLVADAIIKGCLFPDSSAGRATDC